jgi:hypothetical protein
MDVQQLEGQRADVAPRGAVEQDGGEGRGHGGARRVDAAERTVDGRGMRPMSRVFTSASAPPASGWIATSRKWVGASRKWVAAPEGSRPRKRVAPREEECPCSRCAGVPAAEAGGRVEETR